MASLQRNSRPTRQTVAREIAALSRQSGSHFQNKLPAPVLPDLETRSALGDPLKVDLSIDAHHRLRDIWSAIRKYSAIEHLLCSCPASVLAEQLLRMGNACVDKQCLVKPLWASKRCLSTQAFLILMRVRAIILLRGRTKGL